MSLRISINIKDFFSDQSRRMKYTFVQMKEYILKCESSIFNKQKVTCEMQRNEAKYI